MAMSLYGKALDIAPDMHGVYLLRARSSAAAGNVEQAKLQLKQALATNLNSDEAALYQRKLAKFKRYGLR